MGLYDSVYAALICPNCGCQAIVEAQTKDFENAMLTFSVGETVEVAGPGSVPRLGDLPVVQRCRGCPGGGA